MKREIKDIKFWEAWMTSNGYSIDFDKYGLWAEDYVEEHRWKDIFEMMMQYASEENTNNVAEYLALINLLNLLQKKGGCKIEIYGDSKMVVNQMSGEWKIKKGNYIEHAHRAKKLYDTLCLNNEVNIYWIPRESNAIADELSKKHIL